MHHIIGHDDDKLAFKKPDHIKRESFF